jgi:hypothetical protein
MSLGGFVVVASRTDAPRDVRAFVDSLGAEFTQAGPPRTLMD